MTMGFDPAVHIGDLLPEYKLTCDREPAVMTQQARNMFTMLRIRMTTSVPTQQYGNSGIESHVKEFNYARATIHQERCNHPKHWYDVVQAATVARNFVMTRSQFVSGEQLSPYEIETGRKPPLDRLKVPMSLGYKLIDDADRPRPSTLKPQREPVMVCYLAIEDIQSNPAKAGYQCWNPRTKSYSISAEIRHVECVDEPEYSMQTLDIIKRRKSPAPLGNVEEYEGPGVPQASVQHAQDMADSARAESGSLPLGHTQLLDGLSPPMADGPNSNKHNHSDRGSCNAAREEEPASDPDPQAVSPVRGCDVGSVDSVRSPEPTAQGDVHEATMSVGSGNEQSSGGSEPNSDTDSSTSTGLESGFMETDSAAEVVLRYKHAVFKSKDGKSIGKVIGARTVPSKGTAPQWVLTIEWDGDKDTRSVHYEHQCNEALRAQTHNLDVTTVYDKWPEKMSVRKLAERWKLPPYAVVQWLHGYKEFADAQMPKKGVQPQYWVPGTDFPCPHGQPELAKIMDKWTKFKKAKIMAEEQPRNQMAPAMVRASMCCMHAGAKLNTVKTLRDNVPDPAKWDSIMRRIGLTQERGAVFIEQGLYSGIGNVTFDVAQLSKIATRHGLHEPNSVNTALEGPDAELWLNAIAAEVNSKRGFGEVEDIEVNAIPKGAIVIKHARKAEPVRTENLDSDSINVSDNKFNIFVERKESNSNTHMDELCVDLAQLKSIATPNRLREPKTVKEALSGPDRNLWIEAIAKEVKSIRDFGTYKTVRREDIPNGALIMGLKEILKVKYTEGGAFDKCKFRITVQGYSQDMTKGDYKTSFAPAVSYASVKTMIAVASMEGANLSTMDYSNAFLQADEIDVPNQLFVRLKGSTLEEKDPESGEHLFGKVVGSWYGTCQAPALWNQSQVRFMMHEAKHNWKQCATDQCVFIHSFVRADGTTGIIRMAIFVDDSLFAWLPQDREYFLRVKDELLHKFRGTFKENATGIIGIRIKRNDDESYTLDQEAWLDVALTRFERDLVKTKPPKTPISGEGISTDPPDGSEGEPIPTAKYLSLVSTLAWAQHTHPEITYTVNRLQRFANSAKQHHWDASIRCLDYLRGVKHRGITFGRPAFKVSSRPELNSHSLICFVDADLPDVVETGQTIEQAISVGYCRPTTGTVIMYAGAAIHCSANTQPTVVSSTAEAEATALHSGAKYLKVYINLLSEMHINITTAVTMVGNEELCGAEIPLQKSAIILGDNKASLLEFANVGRGSKQKHMRLKLAVNQQDVDSGLYIPYHVGTKEQLADINTKSRIVGGSAQFEYTRDAIRGDGKWTLNLVSIAPHKE